MIDTKALRETHNKAVWELDQFEKLSFAVAKTLVDVYPALLAELDAARAELEAASDAIADRGIAEGNCSLPLPERINYFLSEFKRERSERCDAEMALDKARAEIERLKQQLKQQDTQP